jgi:SAM-dependent methyltransferase
LILADLESPAGQSQHSRIYSAARYYDIAFAYRDFAAECDFLIEAASRLMGRAPASVLELAAGPANHAIELARRGLRATALDREVAMIRYGTEKAQAAGADLDYRQGDMTDFTVDAPVDLALLLLGSAACLLTNDAIISCLKRIGEALTPGGVLVIELPHPRELFGIDDATDDGWEVTRDGTRVKVRWGSADDTLDPVTQVAQVTTTLTIWEDGKKKVIRDRASQRRFTVQELDALARASGGLRAAAWYGGLDLGVTLDDPAEAWRMVALLQKAQG